MITTRNKSNLSFAWKFCHCIHCQQTATKLSADVSNYLSNRFIDTQLDKYLIILHISKTIIDYLTQFHVNESKNSTKNKACVINEDFILILSRL